MLDLLKINIEDFIYVERTGSTNDDILELARDGKISQYSTCFSEVQTKGRGRLMREWRTIPYKSLAFSFLLEEFAEQTPLVLCVAIHKVLNNKYKADVKIKWPNDIYSAHKKLCGILTESYQVKNKRLYIVGIGLNVFSSTEEQQLDSVIGFLENCTSEKISRELLLNDIMQQIKEDLEKLKKDGFAIFKEYFMDNCNNLGKEITLKIGNNEKTGIFSGINDKGYLILKQKDTIVEIPAGEILQNK